MTQGCVAISLMAKFIQIDTYEKQLSRIPIRLFNSFTLDGNNIHYEEWLYLFKIKYCRFL